MKEQKVRLNSIARLRSINIQYTGRLPLLESVSFTRSKEEICNRINVMHLLFTVSQEPENKDVFVSILKENSLIEFLDKQEELILSSGQLSSDSILNLEWYKESIKALLWSISLVEELDSDANEDFLSNYFYLMPPEVSFEDFFVRAKKRSDEKIISEADYLYCYHWWVKHFYDKQDKEQKISVIRERRRAIEWIIQPETTWHDLSLDT